MIFLWISSMCVQYYAFFMHEALQSQAYDAIYINSVQKPETIYTAWYKGLIWEDIIQDYCEW